MTKYSKKVLAVLLSVLMVISALPFSVISAYAADDAAIYGDLDAAIAAYETKMDNMKIDSTIYPYTNMTAAYNAYVTANKLRDAYKYGNVESAKNQFASAAQTLNNATNAMQPWVYTKPSNANKIPSFPDTPVNDSATGMNQFKGRYADNILYTTNVTGTAKDNNNAKGYVAYINTASFETAVYYPQTVVVLYDGVTQPKIPAMMSSKATGDKERFVLSVFPTTSASSITDRTDIFLINKNNRTGDVNMSWHGGGAGAGGVHSCDFDYAISNGQKNVGQDVANSINGISNAMNNGWTKGDYRKLSYFASALVIADNYNFKGQPYASFTQIPWYRYMNSENDASKKDDGGNSFLTTRGTESTIYALNYVPILEAMKASNGKFTADAFQASNYKYGGLIEVVEAVDAIEAYDISGIDFGTNTTTQLTTVGNQVQTLADNLNNARNIKDGENDHTALKNAMINPEKSENQSAKKKYNDGNENNANYTAESWAPFAAAYSEAQTYFAALANGGSYTKTAEEVADLAQRIQTAEAGLVINKTLVDTSALDDILENAYYIVANKQIFNSTDYANSGIEAIVTNCITDIWGSVENYGVETEKAEDSAEMRAKVASYIAPLTAAVAANQMNYDSTIAALGYSMNTAITEAATYEATRADYANYTTLEAAVSDANTMKTTYNGYAFDATIPGQMKAVTTNYTKFTSAIINAIRTLRPAFDKLTNGTIANSGRTVNETYSMNGGRWTFNWTHSTEVVYFKTTREAVVFELPNNSFYWSTTENFDSMLDSINFGANPEDYIAQELTAKSSVAGGTPSDWELNQAQANAYPGGMSVMNANITLSFDNIKVTNTSTGEFAKDMSGGNITDKNTDLTKLLETTEGTRPLSGGIVAKKGTTNFAARGRIDVPATTGSPTRASTVSTKSKHFDAAAAGAKFGFVYYYCYQPFLKWAGYAAEIHDYSQDIAVIDVSVYFELIRAIEAMADDKNMYTTGSWNNLMLKLAAAKSYDYEGKNYDTITADLDEKYQALWDAREALKTPASNAALKAVIEATRDAYTNDRAKCSTSSWAAFETAYKTAQGAIQGKYSDINIRDYAADDEAALAAIAKIVSDLQTAFDALEYMIDFSPVDDAANALISAIADNTYTVDSIQAVKTALEGLSNLNMSEAVRATHFTNETSLIAAIAAEAQTIANLANLLATSPADTSALDGKKQELLSINDPDEYDLDAMSAALETVTATADVTFPTYPSGSVTVSKTGFKYASQDEVDQACRDALTGMQKKSYDVIIQKPDGTKTTVDTKVFGSTATVSKSDAGIDGDVSWYYSCESASSKTTAEKLMATGQDSIEFVVKGTTTLRIAKAATSTQKKVTYINNLNGNVVEVAYVEAGTTITKATIASKAPQMTYYTSTFASIDNEEITEDVVVNDDTVIVYHYDYASDVTGYTVAICGIDYSGSMVLGESTTAAFTSGERVNYNTKVTIDSSMYNTDDPYDVTIPVGNDSVVFDGNSGGYNICAWVKINGYDSIDNLVSVIDGIAGYKDFNDAASVEVIENALGKNGANVTASILTYDENYAFYVHEDCVLYGMTENDLDAWKQAGIIKEDYTVETSSELRKNANGSLASVSTYCTPKNVEIQEKGILIAASKSEFDKDMKFTLNAVKDGKVSRIKSTVQTVGNQYVINVSIKNAGTYNVKYCAYIIYKDANGESVIQYSPIQDVSVTI